jgi:hypothetical protein
MSLAKTAILVVYMPYNLASLENLFHETAFKPVIQQPKLVNSSEEENDLTGND